MEGWSDESIGSRKHCEMVTSFILHATKAPSGNAGPKGQKLNGNGRQFLLELFDSSARPVSDGFAYQGSLHKEPAYHPQAVIILVQDNRL